MNRKWQILFAFLLGTIVAELSADPTDWLFTQRAESGGFAPSEATFYWYCLTALYYIAIFVFAYFCAKTKLLEPHHIIYIMMALVVWGALRNYQLVSVDRFAAMIVLATTAISLGLLWGMKKRVD